MCSLGAVSAANRNKLGLAPPQDAQRRSRHAAGRPSAEVAGLPASTIIPVQTGPHRAMAIEERIHRMSTAEYERIVDTGALADARVELLDGLLVDMAPQGEPHWRVIQRLMVLCARRM